ncbi:MAG: hypothetical protein H6R25_2977 [Proteobacteria bacterium]|jgi:hypothetical protein|nr:hypothetical protein [Pseudomonadota bacterium]
MPQMLYSLTDRIFDLVTSQASQAAKTAPMVIFALVMAWRDKRNAAKRSGFFSWLTSRGRT